MHAFGAFDYIVLRCRSWCFLQQEFKEREFLLHYDVDLLSNSEARIKRQSYDPSIGNFQYREKRL